MEYEKLVGQKRPGSLVIREYVPVRKSNVAKLLSDDTLNVAWFEVASRCVECDTEVATRIALLASYSS